MENSLKQYRLALDKLFGLVLPTKPYLARPGLERRANTALDTTGLVLMQGPYGSGKTSLIATVIRNRIADENHPPTRPIFYLTCDEKDKTSSSTQYLFTRIGSSVATSNPLLKKDRIDPGGGLLNVSDTSIFFSRLDRKGVVFIVDNITFPMRGKQRSLWSLALKSASAMTKSLLIIATNGPDRIDKPDRSRVIPIGAFSQQETKKYLTEFVASYPRLAKDHPRLAHRIHKWDGGLPQFLNLRREEAQKDGSGSKSLVSPDVKERNMADRYAKRILRLLSPEERQCLYKLCWLPRMTTKSLVTEFFDFSTDTQCVSTFHNFGLVQIITKEAEEFCYVPETIRRALVRANSGEFKRAASEIINTLRQKGKQAADSGQFYRDIAKLAGGFGLLGCFQHAYMALGNVRSAANIALLSHGAGLERSSLLELYLYVLNSNSEYKDPSFVLQAAELAHNLGRLEQAMAILQRLSGKKLQPYNRVKFWQVKAAILKDLGQHAAIPEIKGLYKVALPLARNGWAGKIRDADADKEDWKDILSVLLHNRLMVRAFLMHDPVQTLATDLLELKRLLGSSPEFADELCLMAEYELKLPEDEISWKSISDKLLEARRLLQGTGFDRSLAPCLYFYGKYLESRPKPVLAEAAQFYHKAEKVASRVGDFRQKGRARRRRVDLEWRTLGRIKSREACHLLEEVIMPLQEQRRDSFGLRILERLCTLRAEIGATVRGDDIEKYLLAACQAAAEPALLATSDRIRFGQAICRYLGLLRKQDRFGAAQEFVHYFRKQIEAKLEINHQSDDPWDVYDAVCNQYPVGKEENNGSKQRRAANKAATEKNKRN